MATGIICEYNPFHKGHLHHLRSTLASTSDAPIICVMSGHYVQRGEPALLDKWTRTRMALTAGAALVIELPTYYAAATAEWFSFGALSLLFHTGLIQTLSFGIEDPAQLPVLQAAADHLVPESPAYHALLHAGLSQNLPFAQARAAALQTLTAQRLSLNEPNTILVLEYLKSLRRLNWAPQLLPICRASAGYHSLSTDAAYPSASAIRREAANGADITPYLPDCCLPLLSHDYVFPSSFFAPLAYRLSFHTADTLREIDEIGEGLEHRLLAKIQTHPDYETLLSLLKTKRYPTSRLRRILLNIFLDITRCRKEALAFSEGPPYLRILGFRRDQQALLSQLTQSASLPVITNIARDLPKLSGRARTMLKDEIRFSQVYASQHPALRRDSEYRQPLIIV